jgi:hypothetical protein
MLQKQLRDLVKVRQRNAERRTHSRNRPHQGESESPHDHTHRPWRPPPRPSEPCQVERQSSNPSARMSLWWDQVTRSHRGTSRSFSGCLRSANGPVCTVLRNDHYGQPPGADQTPLSCRPNSKRAAKALGTAPNRNSPSAEGRRHRTWLRRRAMNARWTASRRTTVPPPGREERPRDQGLSHLSGRPDLNRRPLRPERSALPS